MAAGDSSDQPPSGSVPEEGAVLPSDPGEQVRRTFPLDPELDRLLRAEALRTRSTESAILRRVLRRHFGLERPTPRV